MALYGLIFGTDTFFSVITSVDLSFLVPEQVFFEYKKETGGAP